MASAASFPYQKLKQEALGDGYGERQRFIVRSSRNWCRFSRRVHIRRRLRLKVPSLRRFLRRKIRVVSGSWSKILRRLKEGQAHFGDIFAGNYLFLQVTPSSLKFFETSYHAPAGLDYLSKFPSRLSVPRTA